MSDKPAIEFGVSEVGLRKSLTELAAILTEKKRTILYRCGRTLSIEGNKANEAVEGALIKAGVIPECLSLNDNMAFCATFNPEASEYFLGVISLRDLDIEESPIYVNPEFCFGIRWGTEDGFMEIVHKDPRLTMVYPFVEAFKEEHIDAIQTFVKIAKVSECYLVEREQIIPPPITYSPS